MISTQAELKYVRLKIVKIKREEKPSRYRRGKTFSSVVFMDEGNRKIKAMGKWTKKWKEGDSVEGVLKRTSYDNDWGSITRNYYLQEVTDDYVNDEWDELRRQGVLVETEDKKGLTMSLTN